MQFLVIAYDGTDDAAPARRQAVRADHLTLVETMRDQKTCLFGSAILNESGHMVGSMMAMDFPSKTELDQWLKTDPYVTGKVWERIDVQSIRVAPPFQI